MAAQDSDEEDSDDDESRPAARAAAAAAMAGFIPQAPAPPPAPPAPAPVAPPPPAFTPIAPRAPPAPFAPPAPAASSSSDGKKATAAYDFTAAGADEISMVEGEDLWVLDDSSDDWWRVRNARGEEGEVPATYVELAEGGHTDTNGDADLAKRTADDEKAEARKERERKRLKALEDEARGLPPSLSIQPPPRRNQPAAASPASATPRTASPAIVTPAPPKAPSPPPVQRSESPVAVQPPPRREDSETDSAARREQRHRERAREREREREREKRAERDQDRDRERDRDRDYDDRDRRDRNRDDRQRGDRRDRDRGDGRDGRERGENGHAAPVEKSKPSRDRVRTWKDRTGAFKVEAEFVGLSGQNNDKIRLHKLNGVVIEVPVEKMSPEDIRVLEHITRRRLGPKDRERDRDRSDRHRGSGDDRERDSGRDRERDREKDRPRESEREREKDSSRSKSSGQRSGGGRKSETDWFEWFLNAGCDMDDCSRYASNFEKDRIDEAILPDLESGTLRSLGLREGDIIRVAKHIKQRYGSTAAGPGAGSSSGGPPAPPKDERSSSRNAGRSNKQQQQMQDDEELARKLQEDLNAGRDGSGLFTNASGGVKNTRRGRPINKSSAPSQASMDAITSSLTGDRDRDRDSSSPDIPRASSPAKQSKSRAEAKSSGFDDDAWTPKPTSKPSTPAPPPLVDTGDQTKAGAASMPSSSKEASNAQALTDAYLESIGLGKRTVNAAPPVQAAPAPQQQQPQQTGYYAQAASPVNGPRAPPQPIPLNQQLLNPLIPTQTGLMGYIPTRSQPSPQAVMMPQPTGYVQVQQPGQPTQIGYAAPHQVLQPQPTMASVPYPGMGMQPQQTGFPLVQQMGQMTIQPTGSPFQAMPQQMMPQQVVPQAPPPPPMQMQPQPQPVQPQQTAPQNINPANVFAQMKAGQFAKSTSGQPQPAGTYDALRPQMTGFAPGGYLQQQPQQQMPQQTGFGNPMGMQPLQAQMTGFAPGGYVNPQQTGMMYGMPQQQQGTGYPYRQY